MNFVYGEAKFATHDQGTSGMGAMGWGGGDGYSIYMIHERSSGGRVIRKVGVKGRRGLQFYSGLESLAP